ncbi:MAG: hypothetical protein L6R38_000222 [Xanthoria sp. 2 TBL-2021]|nr:MAG: hypothetical protein L6R38_000222 [Xanthoria sp. 2 TBL-2021]
MGQQHSPDSRLVYLHCSSIFSGANAQVRRPKKITQLLQKHNAAIKILTKEFPLPAVAAVAKELLEERIFESLPRAKLRYPELFQLSETQEAERAASEVEVIRIEAEAVQDVVLTSDNEGGDECLDLEQGERKAKLDGTSEDKDIPINAVGQWQPTNDNPSTPRAVYPSAPPYFGNTWVPDLMEAQEWKESESIELTKWTKKFSKHAKSLPLSALERVPGKSIAEVLFGTSNLRHSAVHRLPTSAAGILNMLNAAINFAEALKDSKRAEKVLEIRTQLEASVEEVVQHQNLLERKLTAQFADIACRRAELDELERSSIEEMLATDKKQRTEVGSAFEDFLIGSQQISNPCACSHTPNFDRAKMDSKVEENTESSWREHELEPSVRINEAQAYDQSPSSEEEPDQAEKPEEHNRPPCHDDCGGSVEEKTEVSELDLPNFRSKGRKIKGKKAVTYSWADPVAEEATFLVDEAPASADASPTPAHITHNMGWGWPRYGASGSVATGSVAAELYNAPDEAIPAEEPCFAALVEASPRDESYTIAPEEEPLPEHISPAENAICEEDLMEMGKAAPGATLDSSQIEPIFEGFDSAEEDTVHQHHNISHDFDYPCEPPPEPDVAPTDSAPAENIDYPCEPPPEPDVAPTDSAPAENIELLVHHPRPPVWARRGSCDVHSPPPSGPLSTVTSVLEDAAPEAPTKDSHTITLKILNGSKVFRSIVFIRDCTRTAILNEARAYCVRCAESNQTLGRLLPERWDLALVSLKMYGYDTDLSTYKVENLSSLIRTVEKTGIPRFTLQISEI